MKTVHCSICNRPFQSPVSLAAHWQREAKSKPFDLQDLEEKVAALARPYGLDYTRAAEIQAEIEGWLRDPQNDCLRARGDWRWQKMCELDTTLKAIMEPF